MASVSPVNTAGAPADAEAEAEAVWVVSVVRVPPELVVGEDTALGTIGATTFATLVAAVLPELGPPVGAEMAASVTLIKEAVGARVEPPATERAAGATPHCPMGLLPGSASNCSPAFPISSGT